MHGGWLAVAPRDAPSFKLGGGGVQAAARQSARPGPGGHGLQVHLWPTRIPGPQGPGGRATRVDQHNKLLRRRDDHDDSPPELEPGPGPGRHGSDTVAARGSAPGRHCRRSRKVIKVELLGFEYVVTVGVVWLGSMSGPRAASRRRTLTRHAVRRAAAAAAARAAPPVWLQRPAIVTFPRILLVNRDWL